jgi:hypothetical protein
MTLQVRIKGIDALKRKLDPRAGNLDGALRSGLQKAGLIVQDDAQKAVHSPDNPYIGKAGHSVATGRLQASIGTSAVTGSGLNQSVKVGTPYGKTGTGTFARSSVQTTGRGRFRSRTGGRRNTSDPQVYGPIEERKHPFLLPSLEKNRRRIVDIIERALEGFWR